MYYCSCDLLHNNLISTQQRTRGVAPTKYLWDYPRTLGVAFSGGTVALREYIEFIVKRDWVSAISWDFSVPWGEAEIRVELFGNGGYSYLGSSNLLIPQHTHTMRLGWAQEYFDLTRLEVVDALALHEFGHALGLVHEHQHPLHTIQWDVPQMFQELVINQGWTEARVKHTYLNKFSLKDHTVDSFNNASIMIYSIPKNWTIDRKGVPWNSQVSQADKNFVKQLYPVGTIVIPEPEPKTNIYIPTFIQ